MLRHRLPLLVVFYLNVVLAKHKIHIGCLVPSYGSDLYGYQTAIELAAEMINNRTDILPDHEIVMVCGDTFGIPSYAIRGVFEMLQRPANESIRLLIGPAWSRTTVPAYQACSSHEIVELSYAASSVEFQDDFKYFVLFTNVPSTSAFNKARLSVIQYFGWKRVAILREYDDKLFTEAVNDLRNQITKEKLNISLITVEGFSQYTKSHPRVQLENLKKLDARIIIAEFSTQGAVRVFCEAYKMGMISPKYVWLLPAGVSGAWIFSPRTFDWYYKNRECNISEIIEGADGFIVADKLPIRQDNNKTLSGLTSKVFMELMRRRNRNPRLYTSYAFDSIWAAALLFQESLSTEFRPENVTFGDVLTRNAYASLLSKTQFEGLTGPHHFDRRQRLGTVRISQMRNNNGAAQLVQVGTFRSIDKDDSETTLFESQLDKLWKGGKIPVDATTKEEKVLMYSTLQLAVIGLLAGFGLLYSIFFLHFNISKRDHKVVRMSSPMINNVVLLGCFLCYIFVFLLGIDSRFVDDHVFGILCNVRLYVLAIAFSLAFGALFSKTWRVHKIFTAQRAIKKKLMRDFHLMLFVFALVLIDATFITIWVYYDPLQTKDVFFDELKEDSRDIITIPVLKICECTHRTKLLGALYGYKGILLLFGVFLAWETRNVTIPALNDSKYIGMSVYNVVILSAIGATVSMVLKGTTYYELLHVLVSAVVVLSTTVTLTMVFAPKVHEYYLAPPEPQERTRTMQTLQMSVSSTSTMDTSDVYEAYVKPKDVKNKWIQTDEVSQVTCSCMTQQSFTNQEHYGRTIVENRNVLDYSGQILTSVADNGVGAEVTRGFVQTDDSSLLDSGVYIGSCEGKMGSPMSMRNGGVSHDDEAITEQNGSHVDTVE